MEPQAANKKPTREFLDDEKIKYTKDEKDAARKVVDRLLAPMLAPKVKPSKGKKTAR